MATLQYLISFYFVTTSIVTGVTNKTELSKMCFAMFFILQWRELWDILPDQFIEYIENNILDYPGHAQQM